MKSGGGRRIPSSGRKDKDDPDLLLFKELHKRDKDRIASLLQPVSDEFEPNNPAGNYALYRIASGKKGSGHEFLGESDRNDYDWLKTPPATPLFPSLEMEANAPQNVVQREIPIIQPRSRLADTSEAFKETTGGPKSPTSKPDKLPLTLRSVTPSQAQRPTISGPTEVRTAKVATSPKILNQKIARISAELSRRTNTKPTPQREIRQTYTPPSNHSKDVKTKARDRGLSPSTRSTVPFPIPGFSKETPSNLPTDRAISATRGRPALNLTVPTDRTISAPKGRPALNPAVSSNQKPDPTPIPSRRQSCSPSITRGRKQSDGNLTTPKGKSITGDNGTQVFGSRMVEKVMNARKMGAEEREAVPKLQSANKVSTGGFGRITSKSSLDLALKHMEIRRDAMTFRQLSSAPAKRFQRD